VGWNPKPKPRSQGVVMGKICKKHPGAGWMTTRQSFIHAMQHQFKCQLVNKSQNTR
jgi:hypothetical protein